MNSPSPYRSAKKLFRIHLGSTTMSSGFIWVTLCLGVLAGELSAQSPGKVDFAKDVMPLFRQNCVECHGAKKQKNNLRLDRKSSAMKLFSRRIAPGSSANSMVYHRLIGEEY